MDDGSLKRTSAFRRVLLVALPAIPMAAYAAPISVPNTFVNGTVADAEEVNQNFSALSAESNAQDARISALEAASGGTVTSVDTGAGLTGGPIFTTGTISIATGGVTNSMLVSDSIPMIIGAGLAGGANIELGTPYFLDLTVVPTDHGGTGLNAGPTAAGQYLRATGVDALEFAPILVSDLPNLAGDVTGSNDANTVEGLQGRNVSPLLPANGDLLTWQSVTSTWIPRPPNVSHTGDVTGTQATTVVRALRGVPLSTISPSPGDVLTFDGTTWRPGPVPSDARLKRNVAPLSNSLEKIVELNPVNFEWAPDHRGVPVERGASTGLIAQDLERVFPQLVTTDENGYKRVRYGLELKMHMLQAIKELGAENARLWQRIEALEAVAGQAGPEPD